MKIVLKSEFCELEQSSMMEVDGGDIAAVIGSAVIGLMTGVGGASVWNSHINACDYIPLKPRVYMSE